MHLNKKILIALIFTIFSPLSQAQWYSKGADAIVGHEGIDISTGTEKYISLIIGHPKEFSCKPTVSFIIISGKKLGSPLKQRTSKSEKNQMVIYVDGRKFTTETKQTEYTNGIENAMFAPSGLIEALSVGRNVTVGFGSGRKPDLFTLTSSTGFSDAYKKAKLACK
jgi:hypothetical protein